MYVISLEYGRWEDATSRDIYVLKEGEDFMKVYVQFRDRIEAIVAKVRDGFVYNGELPYRMLMGSSDPLEQILSHVYDDDVVLVLSYMPEGMLVADRTRLSAQGIELFSYPEVDEVPEIDDNDPMTHFEALALNFERREYGWRIH